MSNSCDFLIIGSGLAGLSFALKTAKLAPDSKVKIICKTKLSHGNTQLAQGGIAAVVSGTDSVEQHIEDTLVAGAGLCNPEVVSAIVNQGAHRIQDLVDWGVTFDFNHETNFFSLTKEGGHSERRILHVEDHTGADIHKALLQKCKASENISFLENHIAIDLITTHQIDLRSIEQNKCVGAYVLNKENEEIFPILAAEVVLATGGAGKVYQFTSNWSGSTGDGLAMAYRAGARVANLEFMQFHPTCLYHPNSRNFLISEALRGEGAELVDQWGRAFMNQYHERCSLAPRDIVARSIDREMKKSGAECVYLDITHKDPNFLEKRFPAIFSKCMELGIDIRKEKIPVVPAAHYLCGGVLCDLNGGTDIIGLSVLGETACTGLHGSNRLASNSLLECLVLAHNAAEKLTPNYKEKAPNPELKLKIKTYPLQQRQTTDELIVVKHIWDEIRILMWNYMGIVRTNNRLKRAQARLNYILSEIDDYYNHSKIHSDVIELRNIALVAHLSVKCALNRKESRGIHFNLDYQSNKATIRHAEDTVLPLST